MKRVPWLIPLLILCVILSFTACCKPEDLDEEGTQSSASKVFLQTEAESTLDSLHVREIDIDSQTAATTTEPIESAERPDNATVLSESDATVPQSSALGIELDLVPSEPPEPNPAHSKPTDPTPSQPEPAEPQPASEPASDSSLSPIAPVSPQLPTEALTNLPTEAPTQLPTEPSTAPPTMAPSQPPTEPTTEPPTEAPTELPTEPSTEPPKPAVDLTVLEAFGNQYAAGLGFQIDHSMTTANSSFFPPESMILASTDEGYAFVAGQVQSTYEYLAAYLGSIEGVRCRVIVSEDSGGWITVTVLYG